MVFYTSRYFLLKDLGALKSFKEIELKSEKIKFFYSVINKDIEIKYVKKQNEYFCYTYDKSGLIDDLRKTSITKAEYKQAKSNDSTTITKKRFSFKIKNHNAYLDVYKKQFLGLLVLKVVFDSIEESNEFTLPYFFKDATEISSQNSYNFSKNLALYQNVSFMINQDEYFNKNNSKMLLPSFVDSYIGFKIIIFYFISHSLEYKQKFIDFKNMQDFYQMLYFLQKAFYILKEFYNVFDENISLKLASDLKNFIFALEQAQTSVDRIYEVLNDILYKDNFDDLLEFLSERSDFYKGVNANLLLKQNMLEKLRFHLNFFIKRLKEDDLSNNFFLIKIISEYFSKFLGIKKLKKLNKCLEDLLILDENLKMQKFFINSKKPKKQYKKMDKSIKKVKQKLLKHSLDILSEVKNGTN